VVATVPTWVEIFRSPRPRDCDERLLLLESVGIPAVMRIEEGQYGVWVGPEDAGRAYFELTRYAAENRPPPPPRPVHLHDGALLAALSYVVLLFVPTALAANSAFGRDWLATGALDGARVRAGELWRVVTALTLHADLAHYAANAGFGALFGALAGRVYGVGRAWLAILVAGALANALNAIAMPAGRVSLGASTAVFAALGLLCVFRWPDVRRRARLGIRSASVIAAVVLLALLGTGDEHTDIVAHALGFVCGMALGILEQQFMPLGRTLRWRPGLVAAAIVMLAWLAALVVPRA
jgi:membrane associated rhomboid family serine protease